MLREMIRNKTHRNDENELSPVEKALHKFKEENGYDFVEMTNDPRIRFKHQMKQMQKKDYNDDDFVEKFQDQQGN